MSSESRESKILDLAYFFEMSRLSVNYALICICERILKRSTRTETVETYQKKYSFYPFQALTRVESPLHPFSLFFST